MEDLLLKCQGHLIRWFLQECQLYQAFLVLIQIIQITITKMVKINNYNLSIFIKCFPKDIQDFSECPLLSLVHYQGFQFQLVHLVDLKPKMVHKTCTIKQRSSHKCNNSTMQLPNSSNTFTCTISNINWLSNKPHTIKEIKVPKKLQKDQNKLQVLINKLNHTKHRHHLTQITKI